MELPLAEQASIAECRLDADGLRRQRDRYRRLSGALEEVERRPGELVARFSAAVDEELLAETLAIERECCEFFRIDYRRPERLLVIGVEDPDLDPALDALGYALSGARSRQRSRS